MDSPQDFRERKMQERARKIAGRIVSSGGVGKMAFPPLDAMAAPGGQAWVVPEPSREMVAHMSQFCFAAEAEADAQRDPGNPPANEDR